MIYLVRANLAGLIHSSELGSVGVLTLLTINEAINQIPDHRLSMATRWRHEIIFDSEIKPSVRKLFGLTVMLKSVMFF